MTTRKIPPNLVSTPATGVVSEAPKAIEIPEHLQNQLLFHRQVAKRFWLVPNFFVSAPDAWILEKLWAFAAAASSTLPIQHSSKSGLLFSSRVSVRPATALCATAGFLSAMEPQRVTPRLHRKLLSR